MTRNRLRVGFARTGPTVFRRLPDASSMSMARRQWGEVILGMGATCKPVVNSSSWERSQGNKGAITYAPRANTEEGMRIVQTGAAALFSLAALLVAGASEAGEITVMATVAVREPYMELVPAFERATENKVTTMWVGVSTQNERIKGGEIVDLVIGTASGIDELNKLGHLLSGVAMTKSGIGAAVASGAPRPDISSAEALKRALLASKSIALSA